MGRKYKHATPSGEFDRAAHDIAQAKERQRRGFPVATRIERFNELMSSGAHNAERKAGTRAGERSFSEMYDSPLGKARKNRRGRGNIGSASR